MFDRIHSSTESNDTLFNPGSNERYRSTASPHRLPDTGKLLAAVGMPAHAIREVLGFRTLYRRGRLNRGRGGLREV